MKKSILTYGVALALIVGLLKWLEYRYVVYKLPFEGYMGFIALICTGLGIWMGLRWIKPNIQMAMPVAVPSAKEPTLIPYSQWEISDREYEVLQLMEKGLSNQEIADQLFISIHTVKTHASNLYVKLEVKRRTQALQKAKELRIL